jgi:signal transduction histidine kinase
LQLIKEIFEAALLESTQQSITFLPVNLNQLCQEVMDNFIQVAEKKKIKLYFSCQREINVHTHAPHVVRILENILSNAIKFSPCDSIVETTLKEINSAVIISIKDKGPGFREEDKKRMFKKFQRLSALPTGGESSHGLGLYITKTLADRVHAQLVMESENGQGSVFSLSFHGNNSLAVQRSN